MFSFPELPEVKCLGLSAAGLTKPAVSPGTGTDTQPVGAGSPSVPRRQERDHTPSWQPVQEADLVGAGSFSWNRRVRAEKPQGPSDPDGPRIDVSCPPLLRVFSPPPQHSRRQVRLFTFIYLNRSREMREVSHLPVHNGQGWARSKPGLGAQSESPTWGQGPKHLSPHCCPQGACQQEAGTRSRAGARAQSSGEMRPSQGRC